MIGKGLSASIYTEITDLEGELNGFLTYDRQVVKFDQARVRAANQALIAPSRSAARHCAGQLPVNSRVSFQVTTPGFTDRYLRHQNSLALHRGGQRAAAALLQGRRDIHGAAGPGGRACYSFESVNFPGQFLRHANSRVQNSVNDGSALFAPTRPGAREPG